LIFRYTQPARYDALTLEALADGLLESRWIGTLTGPVTIGVIAIACAYLDFRFADKDWCRGHPGLAAFFGRVDERLAMQATQPATYR